MCKGSVTVSKHRAAASVRLDPTEQRERRWMIHSKEQRETSALQVNKDLDTATKGTSKAPAGGPLRESRCAGTRDVLQDRASLHKCLRTEVTQRTLFNHKS